MGATTIEWCDFTFNHVINKAANGTRVKTSEAYWRKPLTWNRDASFKRDLGDEIEQNTGARPECYAHRPRVSVSDAFEDWQGHVVDSKGLPLFYNGKAHADKAPAGVHLTLDHLRRDLFALIDATPHLDWLILTKRPENVLRMWPETPGIPATCVSDGDYKWDRATQLMHRPNVWLGCSVSDQETAEKNIPELLKLRDLCPVHFLSCEPLLGPVDLRHHFSRTDEYAETWPDRRVDWVIAGGESGPSARPCNIAWIRSLVAQCQAAGVPAFVKQLGSFPYQQPSHPCDVQAFHPKLRDKKGGDISEFPEDLRVRQFPTVKA